MFRPRKGLGRSSTEERRRLVGAADWLDSRACVAEECTARVLSLNFTYFGSDNLGYDSDACKLGSHPRTGNFFGRPGYPLYRLKQYLTQPYKANLRWKGAAWWGHFCCQK